MKHSTDSSLQANLIQNKLLEMIQEGVIVISQNFEPVYLNPKALEICQQLWSNHTHSGDLPPAISEISHQLIKNSKLVDSALVMDYQVDGEHLIRIRARQLTVELDNRSTSDRQWLLILLEDRHDTLQEELKMEQIKYNLTERETQILKLLLQTHTYQNIAKTLQISLNTVRFHVKNIYSKKRSHLGDNYLNKYSKV